MIGDGLLSIFLDHTVRIKRYFIIYFVDEFTKNLNIIIQSAAVCVVSSIDYFANTVSASM